MNKNGQLLKLFIFNFKVKVGDRVGLGDMAKRYIEIKRFISVDIDNYHKKQHIAVII